MKFADRLKEARTQKGFTQADLGTKLGITRTTIINWEKGVTTPDRAETDKLSKILDVDLTKFLHPEKIDQTVEYGLVDKMIKTYQVALEGKEQEILRLVEDKKWLREHVRELTSKISSPNEAQKNLSL